MLIKFVILKRVEIKQYSLQMDNQNIWRFRNERSFSDINLFVTSITAEIRNQLSFNLLG